MVQSQNILFDLDDTLIHCNIYFYNITDQFTLLMNKWFAPYHIPIHAFKQKQLELDLAGVHIHGFMKDRFPHSLIETYEFFAKQTERLTSLKEKDLLFELGYSVYDQDYEAYPHMVHTLNRLIEDGHELSLYTGGDAVIQTLKIESLGLK